MISLILGFTFAMGVLKSWIEAVVTFCGVLVIYEILDIILWRIELRTAQLLTQALSGLDDEK